MPGHQLLVLEADGVYADPLPATTLTLGPGQRYSVLVTAHNSTALNYQFHVALYASFVPVQNTTNPRRYTGLVEYRAGAPLATAATVAGFDSRADLMPLGAHSDVQLRTAHRREALPVDRSIPLVLSGNLYDDGITRDVVNNMTYAAPLVPSLYSALTMGALATDPAVYGPQPGAIVLRSGEHIELVVSNPNSLPHPMHLHGHVFQLIEYGPVDKQLLQVPATVLDRITVQRYTGWPMERDTMVVPKYSYATIRFTANNPGVWLLHCHMDIHFAMGMAVTFIEAPDVLQQTTRVPPEMLQLCAAQDIPVHGNAAGNNGLNLTGLPPPPHIAANQSGAPLH
ncbi:ferroxidase fet3 [Coemansia spiralis]|nr:ferroxidase fet3 [Coemansia spiralis]